MHACCTATTPPQPTGLHSTLARLHRTDPLSPVGHCLDVCVQGVSLDIADGSGCVPPSAHISARARRPWRVPHPSRFCVAAWQLPSSSVSDSTLLASALNATRSISGDRRPTRRVVVPAHLRLACAWRAETAWRTCSLLLMFMPWRRHFEPQTPGTSPPGPAQYAPPRGSVQVLLAGAARQVQPSQVSHLRSVKEKKRNAQAARPKSHVGTGIVARVPCLSPSPTAA